jgi:PTH1 family peptidyl-tRNA hydrolase
MFNFRKEKSSGNVDFLIVGLGNPGKKYETTRHNAGFMCIDKFSQEENVDVKKVKFHALIGECYIEGHKVIVMKPQTMMNNSGQAIKECATFYKIPPENIIVIYDDISLEPGKLRIRRKGSAGGHNGIKSIIAHLGSENFPRVKIGVGAKPHPNYDLVDWVLGSFPKDQLKLINESCENAYNAIKIIMNADIDGAMSKYNS